MWTARVNWMKRLSAKTSEVLFPVPPWFYAAPSVRHMVGKSALPSCGLCAFHYTRACSLSREGTLDVFHRTLRWSPHLVWSTLGTTFPTKKASVILSKIQYFLQCFFLISFLPFFTILLLFLGVRQSKMVKFFATDCLLVVTYLSYR